MTNINNMTIHLVEAREHKYVAMYEEFGEYENVKVWHDDIEHFFNEHKEVDCLVSPANAFGLMTGGYDAALSSILGWDFQKKVQQYIADRFFGEQGVGTSFFIQTDIPGLGLIHTPTMRYPSVILDDMIVYYCMRSTLICAMENDVTNVVIPVFGGATGRVDVKVAAVRMREAYDQIRQRKGPEFLF